MDGNPPPVGPRYWPLGVPVIRWLLSRGVARCQRLGRCLDRLWRLQGSKC